jgi:DNA-binding NtrC family response regulator
MGEARATVLVVDDDAEVLESTIAIVEELGYSVIAARNGHEALSIIRSDRSIAVLFTDILIFLNSEDSERSFLISPVGSAQGSRRLRDICPP